MTDINEKIIPLNIKNRDALIAKLNARVPHTLDLIERAKKDASERRKLKDVNK